MKYFQKRKRLYRWSLRGWKELEINCVRQVTKYKETYPEETNDWVYYRYNNWISDRYEFSRPHNFLIKQHDLLEGDICSKYWLYNKYIERSNIPEDYRCTILRYIEKEEDFKPLINARKRKFFQS